MEPQLSDASLQQYWAVLNTVHGSLHPPGAFSTSGHWLLMSSEHLIPLHAPVVGLNCMGMLKPLTSDMSRMSRPFWLELNSATVLGGLPELEQSKSRSQSPVSHWPWPLASKLQLVRPHMRLVVVPAPTDRTHVWPGSSLRPPPGVAAAQTVYVH